MANTTVRRPLSKGAIALLTILLFAAFLCFFAARWFVTVYGRIGFDSILFTLLSSLDGVQSDLILSFLLRGLLPTLLCTALCCALLCFSRTVPIHRAVCVVLAIALAFGLVGYAAVDVELTDYVRYMRSQGQLFEMEYVDPDSVEITFPEQKRNLVYIMLESMESSYLSRELGGAMEVNLIPELYELARDNINFSHNEGVGGFPNINGATWTIGAIVAQTAGIPLKTPETLEDRFNGYGKDGVFLPGVTSITKILEEAGYHTALMVGSNAEFAGRKTYYETQGADQIYDIFTARSEGIIPEDYYVWWGFEDLHLFKYAKQELARISQQDEPFAFTMLTVDTHHIGGYQCAYCTDTFEETYDRSIACASRQVLDFVQWLQQQDFYENTTVIITGDHLSMDNAYFERNVAEDYRRMVYHCILNSAASTGNTKNREYCGVDLFPTTLAAMGCTIEGNRLGLGVNLFSNVPTLSEQWGFDRFNDELGKASDYYSAHFHTAEEE